MDGIDASLNECIGSTQGSQNYFQEFKFGLDAYLSSDHDKASKHFKKCIELASDFEGQRFLEFFAYYGLGYSHTLSSQFSKASECFNKCLVLSQNLSVIDDGGSKKCFKAFSCIAKGDLYVHIGDTGSALKSYLEGLEISRDAKDKERELVAYFKLAELKKIELSHSSAFEYYQKCVETRIPDFINREHVLLMYLNAEKGMGDLYKVCGNYSEAKIQYTKCLDITGKLKENFLQKLRISVALAEVYTHMGDLDEAMKLYDTCLNHDDKYLQFSVDVGIGRVLLMKRKFYEAKKYFKKSFKYASSLHDKKLEATSSLELGNFYLVTGKHKKAIQNYNHSLEIAKLVKEFDLYVVKIKAYLGLGNAYIMRLNVDCREKEGYLKECLELSKKAENRYCQCQAFLGMGDVDSIEGRLDEAMEKYEHALEIAKKIQERHCECRARRSIGNLLAQKKNNASEECFNEALHIAVQIGNAIEICLCHLGLATLYKYLNEYEKSLRHYKKYLMAYDASERDTEKRSQIMQQHQQQQINDIKADENFSKDYLKGIPFVTIPGDKYGTLSGYWELADLFDKLGQIDDATNLFEKYLNIAKKTEDDEKQKNALDRLVPIYKRQGHNFWVKTCQEKLQDLARKSQDKELLSQPWKCNDRSIMHQEMFKMMEEYGREHPGDVKVVNNVRVICSEKFLIGKGSDGTRVYLGLGKDGYGKAVKRLFRDNCTELAKREKDILNEFNAKRSNYVVNYWYLEEEPGTEYLYLILDLCEESLEKFVESSKLEDLQKVLPKVIMQILKGLADLHSGPRPILHRDLRPSNVLRDVREKFFIADFGISQILCNGASTHWSARRGAKNWIAPESHDSSGTSINQARYKKESDVMSAGMVAYYVATKGEHPFGPERFLLDNLLKGNPVSLDKIKDATLKDLLSWMLERLPEDRPSANEALKHPYLLSEDEKFEMLCKVGNQHPIKTSDANSNVVKQLNSEPSDWQRRMNSDVYDYFCTDEVNRRIVKYGSSWTKCLRLIRNVGQHWYDRPRPRKQLFYKIGDPKEYFLRTFPELPIRVHAAVRTNDEWKNNPELKNCFIYNLSNTELFDF
ncbi:LOW QUALITY PROTEIN: uncharacterized protein LOC124439317 [Xenia sp. Carnegie-2017]|uniref:LOW QUALITY PROTEIN: uncharacterized protein LOC124439317 n=1 Tax=Xenia sp. Carnegie-2017 TaxID=2897299 RepID=UPI001F046F6E|nr:LOW QUALITY PROTEIN: uncharacterized protein LOC124439317 [Xenia sp. Carnegie-2017]